MLNFRLIAIGLAALAIAGGLWYWHQLRAELADSQAANVALTATLETERANRATEQADRRRNDETVTSLQGELAELRKPHPVASVLCHAARLPAPSESHPATGAADPTIDGGNAAPLSDIGPALDAARTELLTNAAVQIKLGEWEKARSH